MCIRSLSKEIVLFYISMGKVCEFIAQLIGLGMHSFIIHSINKY